MSGLTTKERRRHLRDLQKLIKNGDWSPPDGLSSRSGALWRELVPLRARSPERLQALEIALRGLDRLDQIRAALDGQELMQVTRSTGAHHMNPLLRAERAAQRDFTAAWSELGFNSRESLDGEDMRDI